MEENAARKNTMAFRILSMLGVLVLLAPASAWAVSPGAKDYYTKNVADVQPFEDEDHDNDGVLNENDPFPRNSNEWLDTDGDHTGNNSDTDDDGDGMPDSYELSNNLNPLIHDGTLDYDLDGSFNTQEFQNGTNPNSLLSCSGSACIYASAPAPAQISFPSIDTTSDKVSAIAGSFNVSNSGGAEYTIPLYVPPGTAGLTPKLALQYRSNGGNGILGMGWSLGALSSISRCPKTRAQDGVAAGIKFDQNDRFCLDGERLVLVNTGATYGADGVEYRTETDSFRKVVSYGGTLANGPAYFRVWHKDGSVSEYGNSSDSKLIPIYMTQTVTWAQNRIEDAFSYATSANNPVIYTYEPFTQNPPSVDFSIPTNEDLRISQIKYGAGNTAGLYQSFISFTYAGRADSHFSVFSNNIARGHDQRLLWITMTNAATNVRHYKLNYKDTTSVNELNKTSKLETITECYDPTAQICLPPTTLTWSDKNISQFNFGTSTNVSGFSTYPSTSTADVKRFMPADFNGDGKGDLIWLEPVGSQYRFKASPSNGATLIAATTESLNAHEIDAWTVSDYNADGYPDILFTSNSALYVYLNANVSGQRSYSSAPILLITTLDAGTEPALNGSWTDPKGIFADINADGLLDVMYDKAIYYMEKDPLVVNGPYKFGTPSIITLGSPTTAGTMNYSVKNALPSSTPEYYAGLYKSIDLGSANFSGDYNGDGLPDLLVKVMFQGNSSSYPSWAAWAGYSAMFLNNGSGGFTYRWIGGLVYHGQEPFQHHVVDLNLDGKSDLFMRQPASYMDNWSIQMGHMALGLGPTPYSPFDYVGSDPTEFNNFLSQYPFYELEFQDMNLDGYPDLVFRKVTASADWIMAIFNRNGRGQFGSPVLAGGHGYYMAINSNNFGNHIFMDVSGDGIMDFVDLEAKAILGSTATGTAWNMITKISNGLGEDINISYKQLSDSSVYTREFDAASLNLGYPVVDVFAPITVVSSVSRSSPTPENANYLRSTTYKYQGLKVQPAGRGSLGFRVVQVTDNETGNIVTNTFRQDYPFIGLLDSSQTHVSGQSTALTESTNTYTKLSHINGLTTPPYLVAMTQSATTQRVAESSATATSSLLTINGVLTTTTTSQSNFDTYGNPGTVSVTVTGDGSTHTTTTTSTYSNTASTWLIGKLTQAIVTRQQGSSTITRKTDYTYDTYGRMLTEVREPQGTDAVKLTTSYEYDAFGNPNKITETSAAGTRYSRMVYDTTGRFVDKTYNGLEQLVSEVTQRDVYGNPETVKGLNGVEQYARYGTFGRQFFTATNAGSAATTQYRLCSAVSCPSGASFRIQTTGTDGSLSNTYADKLGREIRTEVKSFNGTLSLTDTQYDSAGRVKKVSVPYFTGGSAYWATSDYDHLGRTIKVVDAQGGVSTNVFSRYTNGGTVGIQQVSTNQLNQTKTTITNGRGQSIRVVDNLSGYINYTYDAAGNLTQLDANGVLSDIGYDVLGRRISLDDPDQGEWDYLYNAFGEMTDQQDSSEALTHITFDGLGRMATRRDYTTGMVLASDTVWTYGTSSAARNVGQITMQQDYITDYIQAFAYDSLGRPSQTVTSLGIDGADGDYAEYATYDQLGRVFQQIDATAKGVQYVYNAHGYQEKIVEATNTSHAYHTVTQANARGQVTAEALHDTQFQIARTYDAETGLASTISANTTYGVPRTLLDLSLTFDAIGNLTARTRQVQAQGSLAAHTNSETFTYDQLNRLTNIAATGQPNQSLTYDLSGNITSKSGVGSYSYNAARPHAVATAGGNSYTYDAIGNMVSGGGRTAVYNAFRKPVSVTKGTHTTSFEYGPDRSHYKRVDNNGINVTTTLNVGNVEFIRVGINPVRTKRYIGGVMVVTDYNGTHEEHALLTDHLGSTVAMAKANSLTLEQMDYDAFGKRRDLWTLNELASPGPLNDLTTTGFTGHEMLDEVGLIHMQGRVYDPTLGRFMSADPYITELDNTQNMNRYSYVYNNPLTLMDPNGFQASNTIEENVRVTIVIPYFPNELPTGANGLGPSPGSMSINGRGIDHGGTTIQCNGNCSVSSSSFNLTDVQAMMNAAMSTHFSTLTREQLEKIALANAPSSVLAAPEENDSNEPLITDATPTEPYNFRPVDSHPGELTNADLVNDGINKLINSPDGRIRIRGDINDPTNGWTVHKTGNSIVVEQDGDDITATIEIMGPNQVKLSQIENALGAKEVIVTANGDGTIDLDGVPVWLKWKVDSHVE